MLNYPSEFVHERNGLGGTTLTVIRKLTRHFTAESAENAEERHRECNGKGAG